ncbi:MAG: hypothetical protein JWR19_3713 [Pedosphaera sp.]|nr:hypothetical protein [Pedosphaera sp.]
MGTLNPALFPHAGRGIRWSVAGLLREDQFKMLVVMAWKEVLECGKYYMNLQKCWNWASLLLAGAAIVAVASGQSWAAEKAPKRLLVVTVTKGFRHSSIPTAEKVLAELGAKSGAFTVDYARVEPTDADFKGADGKPDQAKVDAAIVRVLAEKMNATALKNYDGVVFANTTGTLPLPDEAAFLDWIKSGKAFIATHSAADMFHHKDGEVDPYIDMLGAEFKEHHEQATVECLNQDLRHPATRAIGKSYVVKDEIYLMKNFSRDRVHGLLSLDKHPNTGGAGDYPIAWCRKYGKGNVFYTSLGHREDVWESPIYQAHLLGGIKWALGLEQGNAVPQKTLSAQ